MATNLLVSTLPCNSKCPKNQSCPHFIQLQAYEYSREALEHFDMHSHEMIQCRYGKVCYAFQRLNGGGYRLDDRSHCAIYKHPSRRDNAHIEKTLGSKKFISAPLRVVYRMNSWTICDRTIHERNKDIEFRNCPEFRLNEKYLIEEIRKNGFEWVMQIPNNDSLITETEDKPAKNSGTFFSKISPGFKGTPKTLYETPKTLWDVAREKMEHPRHEQMGKPLTLLEILAILLYTGTDVYRELRHHEMLYWREHTSDIQSKLSCIDLEKSKLPNRKWPVLSSILSLAIIKLERFDARCKPEFTYHGLHDVNVDPQTFVAEFDDRLVGDRKFSLPDAFMYGTFVSTSTDREVALEFMKSDDDKSNGCLMEIILQEFSSYRMRSIGADVSWISKFPYEKEFLFDKCHGFQLISNDFNRTEGYQIVKLVDISYCNI